MGIVQLAKALGQAGVLDISGDAAVDVTGVAYDSRRVAAGDLFACVRGAAADGHRFAPEALARGAHALLVEEPLDLPVTQARVESVRRAMALAAHEIWGRPSERLCLIGVTGTNGKTTTTHLLEAMALAAGRPAALVGTVGARLRGVDVPIERTTPEGPDFHRLLADMVEKGVEVAAVEVSSHALALERVAGARFAVVAFTHLSRDHLDLHHDMEAYFAAKARLFTTEFADKAAVMVDDEWGRRLAGQAEGAGLEVWRVSARGEPADVTATDVRIGPDGSEATVATPEGPCRLRVGLSGSFNLANGVLAAATALMAGLPQEAIVAGAAVLHRVPGRFEVLSGEGRPRVVIDYAHTPGGIATVLEAARGLVSEGGRVAVVVGAGGDRDPGKRGPMGEAAGRGADLVVVTTDNSRSEDPAAIAAAVAAGVVPTGTPFEVELDRRLAIRRALAEARSGDVVVIAGKGHETGQEAGGRVVPFDDRVVAAEELARGPT